VNAKLDPNVDGAKLAAAISRRTVERDTFASSATSSNVRSATGGAGAA
jgi:hypothetical protein